MLSEKNLHFLSHQADIIPKVPSHEMVILVEYQLNWMNIVDFLQVHIAYCWFSPIFYCSYLSWRPLRRSGRRQWLKWVHAAASNAAIIWCRRWWRSDNVFWGNRMMVRHWGRSRCRLCTCRSRGRCWVLSDPSTRFEIFGPFYGQKEPFLMTQTIDA